MKKYSDRDSDSTVLLKRIHKNLGQNMIKMNELLINDYERRGGLVFNESVINKLEREGVIKLKELCEHKWDRGECRKCGRFAENMVFAQEREIGKLKNMVVELAEMLKSYAHVVKITSPFPEPSDKATKLLNKYKNDIHECY